MHPDPATHRSLEIYIDGEVAGLGKLERTLTTQEKIRKTRRILDIAITDGMFEHTSENSFQSREYYDSVDAWEALLARPAVGEAIADDELIEKSLRLMGEGRSEIVSEQRLRAWSLVRT